MKKTVFAITGAAILLLAAQVQPVDAQGIGLYVGPGGAGVTVNPQPQYRERYYDDRPVYRERREYREPRCRDYYVQNGPYRERVRECN